MRLVIVAAQIGLLWTSYASNAASPQTPLERDAWFGVGPLVSTPAREERARLVFFEQGEIPPRGSAWDALPWDERMAIAFATRVADDVNRAVDDLSTRWALTDAGGPPSRLLTQQIEELLDWFEDQVDQITRTAVRADLVRVAGGVQRLERRGNGGITGRLDTLSELTGRMLIDLLRARRAGDPAAAERAERRALVPLIEAVLTIGTNAGHRHLRLGRTMITAPTVRWASARREVPHLRTRFWRGVREQIEAEPEWERLEHPPGVTHDEAWYRSLRDPAVIASRVRTLLGGPGRAAAACARALARDQS